MTKRILWELKHMTLSLSKNISIYFFSNKNVNYRKSYTPYYASEAALIRSYSSAKDD